MSQVAFCVANGFKMILEVDQNYKENKMFKSVDDVAATAETTEKFLVIEMVTRR